MVDLQYRPGCAVKLGMADRGIVLVLGLLGLAVLIGGYL